MSSRLFLPFVLVLVAASACNCDVPLDHTISGQVTIPLGSDDDCAADPGTELDENGDATEAGDYGVVRYHFEPSGDRCRIVVTSWEGAMADLSSANDEIDAQVEGAGLDPAKASVSLSEVEILTVELSLLTASDEAFDLSAVGPYDANVNAIGEESRIDEVVVVTHDGAGDPLAPTVETTDDHSGLAAIVQGALEDETALAADGNASVDVAVTDLPELTDDGAGDAKVRIDYELRVTGFISVGF